MLERWEASADTREKKEDEAATHAESPDRD